jgi:hypothetical protein
LQIVSLQSNWQHNKVWYFNICRLFIYNPTDNTIKFDLLIFADCFSTIQLTTQQSLIFSYLQIVYLQSNCQHNKVWSFHICRLFPYNPTANTTKFDLFIFADCLSTIQLPTQQSLIFYVCRLFPYNATANTTKFNVLIFSDYFPTTQLPTQQSLMFWYFQIIFLQPNYQHNKV